MQYEPGPESPGAQVPFPAPPAFVPTFSPLAAQVAAQLVSNEQALGVHREDVASIQGDPDGEYAALVGSAIGEVQAQLGSQAGIDPGRLEASLNESIGEVDGTTTRLPSEHSAAQLGHVPGEGGNRFEETQWIEVGGGGESPGPEEV